MRTIWTNDFQSVLLKRRLIKSLEIENDRSEGHDHDQQPLIVLEWIDRIGQVEPARAVKAQGVRREERQRQHQRIEQLMELCV